MTLDTPLPAVMVAPNGARRGKADHSAIPVSEAELVETALACRAAGADGIHLHIRDAQGRHVLDAAQYQSLLNAVEQAVPDMYLQVTSEMAGLYDAPEQIAMMRALKPRFVSVGLRELVRQVADWAAATSFYAWALENDVQVQHILYSPDELSWFLSEVQSGRMPGRDFKLQFVLGTYDGSQISRPENVQEFVDLLDAAPEGLSFDWMMCAFGREETVCLAQTAKLGGKVRVGFENSLWHADGSLATDNAERVRAVTAAIEAAR